MVGAIIALGNLSLIYKKKLYYKQNFNFLKWKYIHCREITKHANE